MTYLVNIIGAGKSGKTLARLLVEAKVAKIVAVQNTTKQSSLAAIAFIGEGSFYDEALPEVDITLITTPDDRIASTCLHYAHAFRPGSVVAHCSGSFNSDLLFTAKKQGCFVASIHPMNSFSDPQSSIVNFEGTFCAMEGDLEALQKLDFLFKAIGTHNFSLEKEKKPLYHAAGVFASNYMITLAKQAEICLQAAGIVPEMAMKILTPIMKSSLDNLEKTQVAEQALTGPLQRGDLSTLNSHLTALACHQELKALYIVLAKTTLKICSHEKKQREAIEAVFS